MFKLIILLVLIIILCLFFTYRPLIDHFSNNIDLNNETCYNYIKNIKKWDVDSLTPQELKVIFTLRTLKNTVLSDYNKSFVFMDGCVIPDEYLSIYNFTKQPVIVTPIQNNLISNNLVSNPIYLDPITLPYTKDTMFPKGNYIDFTIINTFYAFRNIINGLYALYDKEFIEEYNNLNNQLESLKQDENRLKNQYDYLVNETNKYNDLNIEMKNNIRNIQNEFNNNVTKIQNNINICNDINNNIQNDINNIIIPTC